MAMDFGCINSKKKLEKYNKNTYWTRYFQFFKKLNLHNKKIN